MAGRSSEDGAEAVTTFLETSYANRPAFHPDELLPQEEVDAIIAREQAEADAYAREHRKVRPIGGLRVKYSEDQPRDERGRFGSGGGIAQNEHITSHEWTKLMPDYASHLEHVSRVWADPAAAHALNAALRAGETPSGTVEATPGFNIYDDKIDLGKLSQWMEESFAEAKELPHDTDLFRAVSVERLASLSPGDVITDKGYVSTTTSVVTAVGITQGSFGTWEGQEMGVMALQTSAGTPVMTGTNSLSEIVLDKGTSFRVLGGAEVMAAGQSVHVTFAEVVK